MNKTKKSIFCVLIAFLYVLINISFSMGTSNLAPPGYLENSDENPDPEKIIKRLRSAQFEMLGRVLTTREMFYVLQAHEDFSFGKKSTKAIVNYESCRKKHPDLAPALKTLPFKNEYIEYSSGLKEFYEALFEVLRMTLNNDELLVFKYIFTQDPLKVPLADLELWSNSNTEYKKMCRKYPFDLLPKLSAMYNPPYPHRIGQYLFEKRRVSDRVSEGDRSEAVYRLNTVRWKLLSRYLNTDECMTVVLAQGHQMGINYQFRSTGDIMQKYERIRKECPLLAPDLKDRPFEGEAIEFNKCMNEFIHAQSKVNNLFIDVKETEKSNFGDDFFTSLHDRHLKAVKDLRSQQFEMLKKFLNPPEILIVLQAQEDVMRLQNTHNSLKNKKTKAMKAYERIRRRFPDFAPTLNSLPFRTELGKFKEQEKELHDAQYQAVCMTLTKEELAAIGDLDVATDKLIDDRRTVSEEYSRIKRLYPSDLFPTGNEIFSFLKQVYNNSTDGSYTAKPIGNAETRIQMLNLLGSN